MKKFRLYFDKDREEKWINKMCEQGWAMKDFFLGVYTFEPCEPGKYIYRIDLLPNWEGDKMNFVSFMEDSGVDFVCQWYRWVWLRKNAEDGSFELYSDKESMIEQYTRIMRFFIVGFFVELFCFFSIICNMFSEWNVFDVCVAVFILLVLLTFLRVVINCKIRIKKLKMQ